MTLFKKHLQRYWPLWAVWLAGWMLAMPVNLWNEASWGGATRLAQRYDEAVQVTPAVIAIMAPLVAVCVFFYLFKTPAANFIGALPMRREGVFATGFLAGYVMMVVPILLTGFVTLMVEWAVNAVAVVPLVELMVGCMLQSFFWLAFATLCYIISGNGVAGASFYIIFNGVIIVMVWLVQNVLDAFLYGFSRFGEGVWETAAWLTPIFKMCQDDGTLVSGVAAATRFEMLWIYAGVGFLMLLAALGLHHIRKAERAGDLIAFEPIRWVFRISVTLCGGLSLGLLLMALVSDGRWYDSGMGALLAGCCAVAAVISWFAAEMLLQKSFKVFKQHWKGAVVGAVCFVVAICAIDMDWIGFTTRVPSPQQVKSATAEFSGNNVDPVARDGLVYDAETVSDLIALHQYLVDHQDTDGRNYGYVELTYDLGLTKLRREYSFRTSGGGEVDTLLAAAQRSGAPDVDLSRGNPVGGYVRVDGQEYSLTPAQAEAAWAAVREDVEAGRYKADTPSAGWSSWIELNWPLNGHNSWSEFYPRESTTAMNAFLAKLQAQGEPEGQYMDLPVETAEVMETMETMEVQGGEEIVD